MFVVLFVVIAVAVVVVAVAVLVAVLVVVAVAAVAVAAVAAGTAVEDEAEVVVLVAGVEFLEFGEHAALQEAHAHHEDGTIDVVADNLRVGDDVDRRTVDEDVVILLTQHIDGLAEELGLEQLRGVGRDGAHRQIAESGILLALHDDVVYVLLLASEEVGNTALGREDVGGEGGVTQVAVDQ